MFLLMKKEATAPSPFLFVLIFSCNSEIITSLALPNLVTVGNPNITTTLSVSWIFNPIKRVVQLESKKDDYMNVICAFIYQVCRIIQMYLRRWYNNVKLSSNLKIDKSKEGLIMLINGVDQRFF